MAGNKVAAYVNNMYSNILEIYKDTVEDHTKAKDMTTFMTKFHVLLQTCWAKLGHSAEDNPMKKAVAAEIVWAIKSKILEEKAKSFVDDQRAAHDDASRAYHPLTGPGRGKLRYLGGRCIAKAKYSLRKIAFNNLYTNRILSCEDAASLEETIRRQNLSCSLVNISDSCFKFFLMLDSKRRDSETVDKFNLTGCNILEEMIDEMIDSTTLQEIWEDLLPDQDPVAVKSLFVEMITRFMRVANNQFRKSLIDVLGRKKKKAHRTEIDMKKKVEGDLLHSLIKFYEDKSPNKDNLHALWSASVKVNDLYFNSSAFKKADLLVILGLYKIKCGASNTKRKLAETLGKGILSLTAFPASVDPEVITGDDPGEGTSQSNITSLTTDIEPIEQLSIGSPTASAPRPKRKAQGKGTGRRKGKSKAQQKSLDNICVICVK